MASLIAPSHLTLSDVERSQSRSSDFKALFLAREPSYALYRY